MRRLLLVLTLVGGVEAADVADAADPLVHLFFRVGDQVEDAVDGLDVKYVAVLQVLLAERQPRIHLKGATKMASNREGRRPVCRPGRRTSRKVRLQRSRLCLAPDVIPARTS